MRMLHTPVHLDNGQTVDVAASVGAATPDILNTRDLSVLQQAADAALYDGKHSGHAVLADARHATHPSINGRRAGRPGTGIGGGPHEHRHPARGDWIRGLTIRQRYATCILAGKNPGNRPRPWPWRGWVLIHAGQKLERPPCVTR